jgi:NADP-dependent 3-hydroxy acid dehydrogenase YdfG
LGPAPLSQVNREMYDWLMNINLGGCFNGVHAFLPKMQSSKEDGHIIATCSTSGFIAYPVLGLYSASKFAIRGLMTSLRAELLGSNVGVSIVCPGEVTTNIVNSTFNSSSEQKVVEASENNNPDPKALLEVAAEDAQNTYPISPFEAAQAIFSGIENKDFYIFTHKGYKRQLEEISSEYLDAFDQAMFQ